jgi:hypothetical protein
MIDFQWIAVNLYIQLNAEVIFMEFMFHRICTYRGDRLEIEEL